MNLVEVFRDAYKRGFGWLCQCIEIYRLLVRILFGMCGGKAENSPKQGDYTQKIVIVNPAFVADERPGVKVIGLDVENGIKTMVVFAEIVAARHGFDEAVDAAGLVEELEAVKSDADVLDGIEVVDVLVDDGVVLLDADIDNNVEGDDEVSKDMVDIIAADRYLTMQEQQVMFSSQW